VRDDASRDGKPEGLRLPVELPEEHASLGPRRASLRIDADPLHRREVDDEATVADRVAGEAVPPAAHGYQQALLSREVDRVDDVGHASAARDEVRETIYRPVPHLSGMLVVGVIRTE
jgi:hypothetical protein